MCFETTEKQRIKIAKKDIKCWKALEGTQFSLRSACEGYIYKPNIIQPIEELVKRNIIGDWEIQRGYHSCRTREEAGTWGLDLRIVEFVIPKGTRYYQGELEYVSETIMLVI